MANRSESTFGDVNRIWKLKEEKRELRSHLCPLKEQYDLAVQERDSLTLFLQLISKDLYFQLKKNEKKKVLIRDARLSLSTPLYASHRTLMFSHDQST